MLPVPIGVVITEPSAGVEHHVTPELLEDVQITASDPGGWESCSFALSRRLDRPYALAEPYAYVRAYDTRTAEVLFDGRLELPGRDTQLAPLLQMTATGGRAHTVDRVAPWVYADQREGSWAQAEKTVTPDGEFGSAETNTSGASTPRLLARLPRGTVLGLNSRATGRNQILAQIGQQLGRVEAAVTSGKSHTNFRQQVVMRGLGGAGASVDAVALDVITSTAETNVSYSVPAATVAYGVDLRLLYNTGTALTVADDTSWMLVRGARVQGRRYNAAGTLLTDPTVYTVSVSHAQVIADVLGRLLPEYDGTGASITASTVELLHLAYEDGATAAQIFADLLEHDPAFTWQVWERDRSRKFRFVWKPLPLTATLEASTDGGFSSPGGTGDLYNEVLVRWRDERGAVRQTVRTASSATLTRAGITRRGMLDLGSSVGNATGAAAAGDAWLAERLSPRNTGTLRVVTPLRHLLSGRQVPPWLLPRYVGQLVRVRDVAPRQDALNRSRSDGVSVFRISAVSYSSGGGAELTLDSYSTSLARSVQRAHQRLARVHRP